VEQLRRVDVGPSVHTVRHVSSRPDAASELSLIGMRSQEALVSLDAFLDRAVQAGHASVRIIHGIGSGALRRAVHGYLAKSPYCSSYRSGESGEGGEGVTVVTLDV
jgi:DNA mismatch repair protein MutS2